MKRKPYHLDDREPVDQTSWNETKEDQDSGCFKMTIAGLIVILLFLWIIHSSCNTARHMQITHPYGYYMHGKYLSNHDKPQSRTVFH